MMWWFIFIIIGENDEQLGVNFTGIEKLSCRAKNSIGQTEDNININIICKIKKNRKNKTFFLRIIR